MTRSAAARTGIFSSRRGVLASIGSPTICCGCCCGLGGSLEGCRLSGGGIGPGLWGRFATRLVSTVFEASRTCGTGATLFASLPFALSSISPSSFSASGFAGSIKDPLESRSVFSFPKARGELGEGEIYLAVVFAIVLCPGLLFASAAGVPVGVGLGFALNAAGVRTSLLAPYTTPV
jgi:hypothetical protein